MIDPLNATEILKFTNEVTLGAAIYFDEAVFAGVTLDTCYAVEEHVHDLVDSSSDEGVTQSTHTAMSEFIASL